MASQPGRSMTRRDFLGYTFISTLASTVVPLPVLAFTKSIGGASDKPLRFVDRLGLGPELDAPDVERLCRPLHEEKYLLAAEQNQNVVESLTRVLQIQFEKAGLRWHDEYTVGFTYQHYGVPDDTEYADLLLQYCEQAVEFVHAKLTDLYHVDIAWERLTQNDSPARQSAFHGFVGRFTYYVLRAVVLKGGEITNMPYLVQAWPVDRAIHYIVAGQTARPKHGTLYIIPGATSLVAPFSELLHLTFHEPSQRYASELAQTLSEERAQEQARIAGETVNEATAIVVATEFVKKLGCSERIPAIEYMANNLSETYAHLPRAIGYMNRNGVQRAVNIFLENPAKFMAQISNA